MVTCGHERTGLATSGIGEAGKAPSAPSWGATDQRRTQWSGTRSRALPIPHEGPWAKGPKRWPEVVPIKTPQEFGGLLGFLRRW